MCLEGRQVLSIPQAVVLFSSERGERRRKLCKLMAKRRRDLSGGVVSISGTQKENKTLLAVAFTTNPFCELGEIPTITQIRICFWSNESRSEKIMEETGGKNNVCQILFRYSSPIRKFCFHTLLMKCL